MRSSYMRDRLRRGRYMELCLVYCHMRGDCARLLVRLQAEKQRALRARGLRYRFTLLDRIEYIRRVAVYIYGCYGNLR